MSNWLSHKNVRITVFIIGGVTAVLLVFCLGVIVGASVFRPFGRGSPFRLFLSVRGHGAVGSVTAIQGNLVTMMGQDGEPQTISVSPSTGIEIGPRRRASLQDIHVGDRIVVIGSPQNGTIQARFIRVIRAQPQNLLLPVKEKRLAYLFSIFFE